ncbi:MAG: MFS transporter [Planctomycetes bacterium]|nr:MFS transporter [Planctomycetota bacterium]
MLVGIILTTLNLRAAVTSLSDIFDEVAKNVSHFNETVMGVLPLLCFGVFGAIAPALKRRWGYEKSLLFAMFILAAGVAVRSFTSTFLVFLACSIPAYAGMGFGNSLLPPLFKKYFPNHIGPITSLYSVLTPISAGLPPIVSTAMAASLGWRVTLGVWAGAALLAAVPWLLQCLRHPEATTPEPAADTKTIPVYKWRQAWAMALFFGVGGMLPMYTITTFLPGYLTANKVPEATTGTVLFVYNIVGLAHSLIVPLVIGKMKRPQLLGYAAMVLQIVSYLGFVFMVDRYWLWTIVAAPGNLSIPATFQLFNLRARTRDGVAQLSAFVQLIGYIIAAAGPLFFGLLRVITGGYRIPFFFLIAMSVVMAVAGRLAVKKQYLEDAEG